MKTKFNLKKLFSSRGFTLIELLIVIAILGVLAAGILVIIDPIDKINAANDAKAQNDVSGIGRAAEASATVQSGFYPATLAELVTRGELKRAPVPPAGYVPAAYGFAVTPGGCVGGSSCTRIIVGSQLKSKRYVNAVPPTGFWNYDTDTGKSCATNAISAGCP